MSKKILIPLIILAVVGATGLGIFIASNQGVQPGNPQSQIATSKELTIHEIDRTFTVPAELGDLTYQMNGPASILLYSEPYEQLDGCAGKHLGELRLSDTEADFPIPVGGQYRYAAFVPQPMGPCGGDESQRLVDALSNLVNQ